MKATKDLVARAVGSFHRSLFSATKGRVGGKLFGMPAVMLTTTGRKTGKRRRTMLTSPIHDDHRVVLVASYGGDSRNPTWFLNLRDQPDVEITMQGRTRPMRARVASAGEKEELWPRIVERYKGYGQYQTRTDRDIPVVILEPAAESPAS